MWEMFDTIAFIWTVMLLAYGAIAVALVLALWGLGQARRVRHPSEQKPYPN
jgi:hypothetical protein